MKAKNWRTLSVLVLASGFSAMAAQSPEFPTPAQVHEQNVRDLKGRAEIYVSDGEDPRSMLSTSRLSGGLQTKSLFDTTVTRPPVPAGTVSVESLRKSIPKKAKKAYERATRFREHLEWEKAELEYRMAISYFPEYTEAHGDLGVLYVILRRYVEAEAEIRRAVELSPHSTVAHSNLGWTLASLGRYADAERSARKALELDPGNPQAHLLLGGLLIGTENSRQEGFKHLEIAAKSLPVARQRLQELGR